MTLAVVVFIILDVFLALWFIYPEYFYSCRVNLVSQSQVVKLQIKDKKLFNDFVKQYVPCENGHFKIGDPASNNPPTAVKSIKLLIDDRQGVLGNYPTQERDINATDKTANFTYDYLINENKKEGILHIQFNRDYVSQPNFDTLLPLILATKLDIFYKFNNRSQWLDRTLRPETFSIRTDQIGVLYTKL